MFVSLGRFPLEKPDAFEQEVLALWRQEDLLARTLEARAGAPPFVFYEGPPTANGRPGIHHVLARTLKDAVCRYWTMVGYRVERKAGWDTHGLPVELEVEKQLGISGKPEIEKYGIAAFNAKCRESVWRYKQDWERLSERIGYLLDYEHPYVTYEKDYIESVWFLLTRFAANGLLYRGRKVLPWCGRCGTGLSSHEVGQGYKDLDDPSVWVSFPLLGGHESRLASGAELVAWTTTPWTLPSNFAACVHPDFEYAVVKVGERKFILLESKIAEVFGKEPCEVLGTVKGSELENWQYEPLFAWTGGRTVLEGTDEHRVASDPFVSAEDGTGVVHMAPYGADDFRIGQRDGYRARLCVGEDARLLAEIAGVPAGTFFRDANKDLARDLKQRGRLLKLSQYRHSYPHCWRCDTPLIYFPSPAWFLRTTAYKDEMLAANAQILWSPPEIGTGRMGEWLANNVDWALSRDRYWGTPLPVWVCDADDEHFQCVGSFEELHRRAGGLPEDFDPHRPGVDAISFPCVHSAICKCTMRRVKQVIDCWFDSGAMPYAQHHWPFENRELLREQFPADYIAEGVDQTRGWFYTLHAIGVFMSTVDVGREPELRLPPGPAYKSCLVNGLLLDKNGQKMSKRLGNLVDPHGAIERHGVDAIRWSLLAAGAAHQSRRYDDAAIEDVRRRVLGTLSACYDFFALYTGTEGWTLEAHAAAPARAQRPPLDRWILARLDSTTKAVRDAFRLESIEPHLALRRLDEFIVDELSNWYVRRSRRRFWGAEGDAQDAFATLYEVLHAVARLIAPVAPFLADALWRRLVPDTGSVHCARMPEAAAGADADLESALEPILAAAKLGRARREKAGVRVRQPLASMTVLLPNLTHFRACADEGRPTPMGFERELMEELNVKRIHWAEDPEDAGVRVVIKPNFPTLGPKAGAKMKAVGAVIGNFSFAEAQAIQWREARVVEGIALAPEDVVIQYLPAEGQEAETDGFVTIVLDTQLTPALEREGLAREVLNRVQTQRKESGFEVGDRIELRVSADGEVAQALQEHGAWIADEALAPAGLRLLDDAGADAKTWELPGGRSVRIAVTRIADRARV
jgi:isoleucyl-tRNA synthetase